ncbi:MAG: DMT family transporter [Bacteroidales bacterium]|nr:DMT family transporter [Bacteroidales bacterium]
MLKLKLNNTAKGYLLISVSVLAMANVYIFSKASLNLIHISQFGVYWFGFGITYNFIFNRKNLKLSLLKPVIKKYGFLISGIGILEVLGTSSFFFALKTMSNPALVSFFSNITPVFVTILGISLLNERFNFIEIIGVVLAITGSFIIAYNPGLEIRGNFYKALLLIIFSGLSFSVSTILSKHNIKNISPSVLSINRSIFLFITSLIFLLITHNSFIIPVKAFLLVSAGSFLGPFLAAIAGYSALKYIEASKSSVIGSSKALFVLLSSWLFFSMIPTTYQLAGGLISVFGIFILTAGKSLIYKKTKKESA